MPKFSIVIPVYNVEKYLKRTLDSVFNQTYQDFEVIVVNDGCTDKSMEIAKKYKTKIIDHKQVGVSEARNIGEKRQKENTYSSWIVMITGIKNCWKR